ncbi:GNAT family N-acetyltransferase [Paenibacillus albidus]|uniref:GNAT family N-acetyltransferase n=1 Tax=Paenibacillus albidus TaxID=2041023 RepID=UPI001BE5ED44|nr:GNAT family N-acetyltransferase [Paenibacillus albidus]MBT2293368.1 GNAT family N-acetyltransferase [Paenibacillus albidus]
MTIQLRELRLPEDYTALAALLNTDWSEPTTAEQLEEEDAKLYKVGHTYKDEEGRIAGYDRSRRVAVTPKGEIVGYVTTWRAPWTAPGHLNQTLLVDVNSRKQGVGQLLLHHALEWSRLLGADTLVTQTWDDSPESLRFAERNGFVKERHTFQSVVEIGKVDWVAIGGEEAIQSMERQGLRFTTLAEEQGADSEQKIYELYKQTLVDIPGFTGDVPVIGEWRKWYLQVDGYAPERVIIVADGDTYLGVSNVLYNPQTNGMYHEYTGVSRDYRGNGIAYGLKVQAISLARQQGAAYIRTDNDSTNAPILHINRRLGYEPLRGSYRMVGEVQNILQEQQAL